MARRLYSRRDPPFFSVTVSGPDGHDPIWKAGCGFPDSKAMRRLVLDRLDVDRALELLCADNPVGARVAMALGPEGTRRDGPTPAQRLTGKTWRLRVEYGLPTTGPDRRYGHIHWDPPWDTLPAYFSRAQLERALSKAEASPMGMELNRPDVLAAFKDRHGKCFICDSDRRPLGLWPMFPYHTPEIDRLDDWPPSAAAPPMCPECAHAYLAAYFDLCGRDVPDAIPGFYKAVQSDDPNVAPGYLPYMKSEVLRRRGLARQEAT